MDSVLNFDFIAPQRIVFGWGRRGEVGALGRRLGRRAFIVSGLPEEIGKPVLGEIGDILRKEGIEPARAADIAHEPEVADVDRAAATFVRKRRAAAILCWPLAAGRPSIWQKPPAPWPRTIKARRSRITWRT